MIFLDHIFFFNTFRFIVFHDQVQYKAVSMKFINIYFLMWNKIRLILPLGPTQISQARSLWAYIKFSTKKQKGVYFWG